MNPIAASGYFQIPKRGSILVTQGVVGSTLVAGKRTLFRMYMDPAALAIVDHVVVTVSNPNKSLGFIASKAFLLFESGIPNGPSVGIVVSGCAFPTSGTYSIRIAVYTLQGTLVSLPITISATYLPTKDLRLLVNYMYHEGVFGPTPDWTTDVNLSMARLGSMLPVRDCVQGMLNGEIRSGLRYAIGNSCDGWTADYYKCVYEQTLAINAAPGDDVDVTIEFRWGLYFPVWNPPGDPGPGGNSGRPPAPYNNLRRAACVAGPWQGLEMTAGCFGQEIGHNFGLEAPGCPQYQDPNDPGHSKDALINDPFAFDFVNNRPFNPAPPGHFLGDVMNNTGGGAWQGRDLAMYNACDWEHLRQQFMLLNSTGTETNPAYVYVCGPKVQPKPIPPATWTGVLRGQADGPLVQWGPHGIIVGPPPSPDRRIANTVIEGLLAVLDELGKEHVQEVYLPYAQQPFPIVSNVSPRSLRRNDLEADSKTKD